MSYPSAFYPAADFYGPASLQKQGAPQGSTSVVNTGKPYSMPATIVTVLVIVLGGYALFHWNYIRK